MALAEDRVVSALRSSLKEAERLRRHNRELLAAAREPIAIVGMSCRFPGGVSSPEELWSLVRDGVDAISGFPTDRGWDLERLIEESGGAGGSGVRDGGFVYDAGEFDPEFFRITPREAPGTDPQQRQLLEAAWEAIEDAGVDPQALAGSLTGVFAGAMYQDYGLGLQGGDPAPMVGGSTALISGRVAYALGLEGPAVSVDTACSSSLVAIHMACQALRAGECSLALAGGVTVLSTPSVFETFSHMGVLAPDGRCKAFADAADGTSVGEGVGVLLLERLSDASRNGHPVHALLRGSAINQDGASNGFTAPNGPSQQRVIRAALANAGLAPQEIDAVEAHGTGTVLGDPIEAQALIACYGRDRPAERPLWVGSVKSNIGHTQATAGVAGVIKLVMAMRHGQLPRTLHVELPSTHVDWTAGAVSLLLEQQLWPRNGRPRRAAVSSFGISGTNAHTILEEAPLDTDAAREDGGVSREDGSAPVPVEESVPAAEESSPDLLHGAPVPWVLSARGGQALREQALRLHDHLHAQEGIANADTDVALALMRRSAFEHRAVVLGRDRVQLLAGLEALAAGRSSANVLGGAVPAGGAGGVVFAFPGQGSQWEGMAVELLDASPLFAHALGECDQALGEFLDWSVAGVLRGAPGAPSLQRLAVVQPTLFAVMVALARLWGAYGVRPDAVVGHSQGEIAAAHVSGGLSLRDAARAIALRSEMLTRLVGHGYMAWIAEGAERIGERLGRWDERIVVAAVNGPHSVVVAGDREALQELLRECAAEDVRAREIPSSVASHSPHIEAFREEVLEVLSPTAPRSGEVPFYSTLTGGPLDTAQLDAAYWYRNMREPVQFERATRTLLQGGHRVFIEISPHPVITAAVQETLDETPERTEGEVLGSLRRGEGGPERFLRSLGEAWTRGVAVDWSATQSRRGARAVRLPTYPFQRRRWWLPPAERGVGDLAAAGQRATGHPLLRAEVTPAEGAGALFTGRVSLDTHPWLADHAVLGTVLLPGTALLEMALYAGSQLGCPAVSDLAMQTPLILDEQAAVQLQVVVGEPDAQRARTFAVYARTMSEADRRPPTGEDPEEGEWVCHATGTLVQDASPADAPRFAELGAEQWPPAGATPLAVEDLYEQLMELGLEFGPAFQGLQRAWRRGTEIYAEAALGEDQRAECERYTVHPALLDCALHGIGAGVIADAAQREAGVAPGEREVGAASGEREADGMAAERGAKTEPTEREIRLPFAWSAVSLHGTRPEALRVSIRPNGTDAVSVALADAHDGTPVMVAGSLAIRPLARGSLDAPRRGAQAALLRLEWTAIATDPPPTEVRWATIGPRAHELASALRESASLEVQAHADLAALLRSLDAGEPPPQEVFVDCRTGVGARESELLEMTHARTHEALELVHEWLAQERLGDCRLVLIGSGAVVARAGEHAYDLAAAPTWGLLRSAQAEHPGRFVLMDIDEDPESWRLLAGALAAMERPEVGGELALRGGMALAPRLVSGGGSGVLEPPAGAALWRLASSGRGTLDDLRLVACPEVGEPLGEGQVRVAVRAAGLNFHDVVGALGMLPAGEEWLAIGSDGAGVVLEVGSGVSTVAPGDRVMGMLLGAFGSVAVGDHRMLARIPAGWSFVQAASAIGPFLTAYCGLVDLGRLRGGERVLVHAAAGGVGMAAVQLARHFGAEVFATASPSKWEALEALGIPRERLASSRDSEFKERFLRASEGRGVDVVLNSLARELVDASLELLGEGGRFLEMGKTDIRDPEQVAADHPGVRYRAFAVGEAGSQRVGEMLTEILALFERGALTPLPTRAWDVRRAPEAFRFMSQARHVGKLVLTLPDPPIDPRGTALVTGGTGALGALLARRLVRRQGVRSLILVSRRGREAPGAVELERELTELGARVRIAACDVSDRGQLQALLEEVPEEHPLSAVVHTAAVLDDGVIEALDAERLDRVLAPKLNAAWHLHELTCDLDLQAFVLYSSASGTLGMPGQGNYAAANTFLDTLAAHRRSRGLVASSMAWGWWEPPSEATAALGEEELRRVRRAGLEPFSAEEGLDLFDAACACGEALTVPVRFDMATLRVNARAGALPPMLQGLVRVPVRRAADTPATRLAGVFAERRPQAVLGLVREEVAAVMGHETPEAIEPRRSFKDLGFDSLLAVELRNRLQATTGLRLPATLVFDYSSPQALADHLLEKLEGATVAAAPHAAHGGASNEPVAIVGIGCRYPGSADSPGRLWEMVAAGVDAIGPLPRDRDWDLEGLYHPDPDHPGTSYVREGGFVYDMADFDADFFAISPHEAATMDPQQRLLLEAAWEAIERAGIDPRALLGSSTGVFAGTTGQDYASRAVADLDAAEGYLVTSAPASVLSGRLAYTLGLEGPAVTLDTACSSSLVAIHMACQALRAGECSLALAGGATILCTPLTLISFSRQRGFAPDGRCKSFAAGADGTSFSEGVGVVLLERLSDAERLRHPILAVVRGSAINQDGASNGLSAPNGLAQQRVIRQALANAGVRPEEVDAVDGHGTGTALGDPIEAQALLAVYGADRPAERPLWLGSMKSNIGHAQAAAGVAGVIKMTMALRHGVLPKTLHVGSPTAHVDWDAGGVALLTEARPWERNGAPRRAGVSSFGISGTNAHVILEEPPGESTAAPSRAPALDAAVQTPTGGCEEDGSAVPHARAFDVAIETQTPAGSAEEGDPAPWVLSGRSREALRAQAGRLHAHLAQRPYLQARDVAFSLATRSVLEHRAVVAGGEIRERLRGLQAIADGADAANAHLGRARPGGERLAFLFTGQGAQRVGMGYELHRSFEPFAEAFEETCGQLEELLRCPLRQAMFGVDDAGNQASGSDLHQTTLAQAALFTYEVALFRLLERWGVTPEYLLGHSIGELAAAHVAGVFSLADACKLVAARGRLMGALPGGGAMVAVQASEEEALELLGVDGGEVALAAVNAPSSVVLSGEEQAVLALADEWRRRGRKTKRLQVSHAFHSPRMDAMLGDFGALAREISYAPPALPVVSNVNGALAGEELCSPEYWVQHVRHTVRFADGVSRLCSEGVRNFLELGPDGVLSALVGECLQDGAPDMSADDLPTVSSLAKEGQSEVGSLLGGLAQAWCRGASVAWDALFAKREAQLVELPTYAFQRRRLWLAPADAIRRGPDPDSSRGVEAGWRYRVDWKPIADPPASAPRGAWPVLIPARIAEQPWVARLLERLGEGGARVVPILPRGDDDPAVAQLTERLPVAPIVLEGKDPTAAQLGELLRSAAERSPSAFGGVLSLLALDERPHPLHRELPAGLAGTLALMQALAAETPQAPLWLLTQGALAAVPADRVEHPRQAQAWGLALAAALERPQSWGGVIDLPETPDERALARLITALAGSGEDQLALRSTGALVRRVVRASGEQPTERRWSPPAGTVLVTGGTGGVGAHVARWLAREGAQHLLLASRRGAEAPGAQELERELRALGVQTRIAACDIAEREQLSQLIDSIPDAHPLEAVFHVAGVPGVGAIDALTPTELAGVLAPKATAALHLDELTRSLELSAFVLFSSISATFGSWYQAPYAAANAALDALAANRRAHGLPATSVAWGGWDGEGMAAELDAADLARRGLGKMAPERAIEELQAALDRDEAQPVIADIRWEAFALLLGADLPATAIRELPEAQGLLSSETPRGGEGSQTLAQRLADMSAEERRAAAIELVCTETARVLGHASAEDVDPERAFKELGLSSLAAVELRNRMLLATGLGLPMTLAFDHPSPAALGEYLLGKVGLPASEREQLELELDKLERSFAELDEEDLRARARERLQALLAKLDGADGAAREAVAERIGSASDEEIFTFIDQELEVQ